MAKNFSLRIIWLADYTLIIPQSGAGFGSRKFFTPWNINDEKFWSQICVIIGCKFIFVLSFDNKKLELGGRIGRPPALLRFNNHQDTMNPRGNARRPLNTEHSDKACCNDHRHRFLQNCKAFFLAHLRKIVPWRTSIFWLFISPILIFFILNFKGTKINLFPITRLYTKYFLFAYFFLFRYIINISSAFKIALF